MREVRHAESGAPAAAAAASEAREQAKKQDCPRRRLQYGIHAQEQDRGRSFCQELVSPKKSAYDTTERLREHPHLMGSGGIKGYGFNTL